jgi:hypothetical protein
MWRFDDLGLAIQSPNHEITKSRNHQMQDLSSTVDPSDYCREVESYLCRKNDGHLIRIVGPAFDQVRRWAARGVPLSVAFRGIDRRFERYYAKGPRRRPLRIEFCEADVLDIFDEWLRAVGLREAGGAPSGATGTAEASEVASATTAAAVDAEAEPGRAPRRRVGLAAHLERVVTRLRVARAAEGWADFAGVIEALVVELDTMRADAARARGEARLRLIDRLAVLDAELVAAIRQLADPALVERLDRQAEAELSAFRERMPAVAFARAVDAALARLLRQHFQLPAIAFD